MSHLLITLPNTEIRLLESAIVGDTYRLLIALPDNYATADAANHADLPTRVFLSVGEHEETDDPLIDARFQFVTNMQTLAQTLTDRQYRVYT